MLQNLDEIQVKIVVKDIDDNSPQFLQNNITIGTVSGCFK